MTNEDRIMIDPVYTRGDYLKKNPTWHVEGSPWKAKHILDMINRNRLEPHTVCEVGCGAGEILNQLHGQMPQDVLFSGYEISPQAFEICQQRAKPRLRFFLKDILLEDSAPFDVVLAIDVFEHIEDYLGFLRKLHKRGKHTIFHIPLDMYALSVLFGSPIRSARRDLRHLHYFSKETALETLRDAGYEITDYFYTPALDLYKNTFKSSLVKFPRKILFRLNPDLAVRSLGGYSLLVLAK